MSEQTDAIDRVRAYDQDPVTHQGCDWDDVHALLVAYDAQTKAINAAGQSLHDAEQLDKREAEDHESYERRLFCDGGAARLGFAIEAIRSALGLQCGWPKDGDES